MANVPGLRPVRKSATAAPPAAAKAATAGLDILARALVASAGLEAAATIRPAEAAREAEAALALLAGKPAGRHRIGWRRATLGSGAAKAGHAVLEIVNDDMPFLLDSVLGEAQARGLTPRLVLHPIFKTRRDAAGRLEAVTAPGDRDWGDGRQESYIALYLDPLDEAAEAALAEAVAGVLDQVRVAVADWKAMLARLDRAIVELRDAPVSVPADVLAESVAFLEWLRDGQFTFLGARDYRLEGPAETGELSAVEGQGLGLLRNPDVQVLRRGIELVAMTPEVRRFFDGPEPLIITKSNVVSRVHRRVHMDYVGIKLYGGDGRPAGELRLVGLLTSSAYTRSPRSIPILRHKVARVIELSGAPPESHDGKALLNVLETFPRDELFQIGVDDLARWSAAILDLDIRPRIRVLARPDSFDRFVSLLAFVPRDRFSTRVRERMQALLCQRYNGHIAAFYPHFTDGPLVRVHFIVGRREGTTPVIATADLERDIAAIVRTWEDELEALLGRDRSHDSEPVAAGASLSTRYARAFPAAYAETFPAARAVEDIARIERLSPELPVSVDFYRDPASPPAAGRVAIYRLGGPLKLSDRVPVLENLGFTVVDERSYRITPGGTATPREVTLHDMVLECWDGRPLDIERDGGRLEEAFLAVWRGATESDTFNRLVMAAGLDWRQAALVRAYAVFLRQLGSTFGLRYVADTAVRHAAIAADLVRLFDARFDPDRPVARRAAEEARLGTAIEAALAGVASLDEDRILRQLAGMIGATVRTNFHRRGPAGEPPPTIALKFEGARLDMAPPPRTYREIWVWSPRVEAVHLRFAPIARGGIRWSDRAQDFRTEVLGLAKAQQVKNAVIVPAGAKGGFVPKHQSRMTTREEVAAEGVAAYTIFVEAMLSITDDIRGARIVPPDRVVRHDGDDPYLVVAADKGTATFSDTANALSVAHGFWLGDAFASGGSAGYDHKGLAITSRGVWECVKRHFRELDRDIQAEPFTAVGVGDMSGDVFGNGMLQSRRIRLVAAFDHRDIFIDPDPEPEASWIERRRLFELKRSSWADYDRAKLSRGGGVFSRSLKSIELSEAARALLGLAGPAATPAEVMHAILKAEADLLFFGGIGTFIRAAGESDAEVGDRSNDAIRITAADVRAKVIGEGANLGMTQRARVEAAAKGVRLNTDFIDNSAGVNTSDQEVNIKIALAPTVRAGRLALADRNALLEAMADDVAKAVLRNNYQQSLSLSLAVADGPGETGANARLIRSLEARGLLDRRLEALPSDRDLAERQRAGRGLTRPEHAVLSSYAKIALLHDLLASAVPDDAYMRFLLADYFPPALQQRFPAEIEAHRLGREIIATTLTNGLVNRLGAPTPLRLADETARPVTETAFAFMAAREVFGLADLWRRIDLLDGRVAGAAQLELYGRVRAALRHAVAGYLRAGEVARDLSGVIERHKAALADITTALAGVVPEGIRSSVAATEARFTAAGVPAETAAEVARLALTADVPVVADAARAAGRPAPDAAAAWLGLGDRFGLDRIVAGARDLRPTDDYDRLAIAGAEAALADARRRIALAVLAEGRPLAAWLEGHAARIERTSRELLAIAAGETSIARLTVAATRLGDLARDLAGTGADGATPQRRPRSRKAAGG